MTKSIREILEQLEDVFIVGLLLGMIHRALNDIKKGGSELAPSLSDRPGKKSGGA